MACTLPRPDPQALFNRIKNNFSVNVLGGASVIPESNEWYVVANDYAMMEEMYSIVDQQMKETDPRYACCENLTNLAALDGVYPKPAAAAQGYVRVIGTAGAAIPSPLNILLNGLNYRSIGSVPTVIPAAGAVDLRVQALAPGAAGNNQNATSTSAFVGSPAGLTSIVPYGTSFCSGADAETCEAFRTRYLVRKAYKPRATAAWLQEKMLEWPCVTRVFERAGNCCVGDDADDIKWWLCVGGINLEFYAMFDNTFECGVAPKCAIDDLNTWLFGTVPGRGQGQVEIGVYGKVHQLVASKVSVKLYGLYCLTAAQQQEIQERFAEVFAQFPPSTDVDTQMLLLSVAQVAGATVKFELEFKVETGTITLDTCGGLVVPCDVIPCFAGVEFVNNLSTVEVCS
jgi:hypothetical protein